MDDKTEPTVRTAAIASRAAVRSVTRQLRISSADAIAALTGRARVGVASRALLSAEGRRAVGEAYHSVLVVA